jgi:hypothetical protein
MSHVDAAETYDYDQVLTAMEGVLPRPKAVMLTECLFNPDPGRAGRLGYRHLRERRERLQDVSTKSPKSAEALVDEDTSLRAREAIRRLCFGRRYSDLPFEAELVKALMPPVSPSEAEARRTARVLMSEAFNCRTAMADVTYDLLCGMYIAQPWSVYEALRKCYPVSIGAHHGMRGDMDNGGMPSRLQSMRANGSSSNLTVSTELDDDEDDDIVDAGWPDPDLKRYWR